MDILASAGGKPYLVGGAVRDLLVGKTPYDYDIASDLPPERVFRILQEDAETPVPVVDNLGHNFGVVVGVFDGHPVEIATFRTDVNQYNGSHRPASVRFSSSVEEDLARRDFTCNAMAMDRDGVIIDPFGGREDISRKLLRPVGNAEERYREDPLRLYRACRFASQLGFAYSENGTDVSDVMVRPDFWKECNAQALPMERVRKEMEKLLLGDNVTAGLSLLMSSGLISAPFTVRNNGIETSVAPLQPLAHLNNLPQNTIYHCFDAWHHTMEAVRLVPKDLTLRWAMLFHDAGKGLEGIRSVNPKTGQPMDKGHETVSAQIVKESLPAFGYNRAFVNRVTWLVRNHMMGPNLTDANEKQILKWLRRKTKDFRTQKEMSAAFRNLNDVFFADMSASRPDEKVFETLRANMQTACHLTDTRMPIHSNDLAISGKTVMQMIQGTTLTPQTVFPFLTAAVQNGLISNEYLPLRKALEKKVQRVKREQDREYWY